LVYEKLISLLKQQKTYWKQREKIRWVKEGDAGTRFFHAHATLRHRKNSITTLQDSLGNILQNHEHKSKLYGSLSRKGWERLSLVTCF
jgi:hypothetical protein